MLTLVPHKQFTFAKAWIMSARFEVRRIDLPAARKLLGTGIGMCPKEALFKGYIQLEMDVICLTSLLIMHCTDDPLRSFESSTVCERYTKNI
jgi:hypothetical protein